MSDSDGLPAIVPPWRFFDVTVCGIRRLSPTFVRMTVTGHDLDQFMDLGHDARVKVVLPAPSGGYDHLPRGGEWYLRWRQLPRATRNPLRTYTTRYVRPDCREVDIDIVLHGENEAAAGPGWAHRLEVAQPLVLLGPDATSPLPHGGVEFVTPGPGERLILVGDETAVPAIANIVSQLPEATTAEVWLEVPVGPDAHVVDVPAQMTVTTVARGDRAHGELLLRALREHADAASAVISRQAQPSSPGPTLAWVAGEAGFVRSVRRHLIEERRVDREHITFMGYWKRGCVGG
ncbi:MAG: siderophore-interacting protein [Ornithinimicrobium sp.]